MCFGIRVPIEIWAKAVGIRYGDVRSKKCEFCNTTGQEGNFCSNCGNDLRRNPVDVGPREVIELTHRLGKAPPRSISLVADGQDMCVCQVLAEGLDRAEFDKPMEHFAWKGIANEIGAYVAAQGLSTSPARLFAIAE